MLDEPRIIAAAVEHASREHPKESCGFVVKDEYVLQVNVHENPEEHFFISALEFLHAERKSPIQAIVHSHSDGTDRPSFDDLEGQIRTAVPWLIVPYQKTPFWFGDQIPIPELVGRVYRYGVTDCFTVVRDWYRLNRGVTFPFVPTEYEWWEKDREVYLENYWQIGFRKLKLGETLEVGDVLLGRLLSKLYNHIAVYVGNTQILHHLPNRVSVTESLGPWQKTLDLILRYDP